MWEDESALNLDEEVDLNAEEVEEAEESYEDEE